MATPLASQKWKYAQQVERELQENLKNRNGIPLHEVVERLIQELRISCEATIFLDFEYATREEVGSRLWSAHVLIKDRYKKMVAHYREKEPKKHVERRKLEKHYVDFIKTTQFFYKGYIQRLASHFSGMKELRRIAHRLSLESLTIDTRVKVSPKVEHLIEMSCHATLLQLGDLSRYRNELRTKDRSWEPALGFYSLAGDLCPDSGSSHNQMAVIALADANHLDALYHLYRALAIKYPHPLAKGNLEVEFKKIQTAWDNGKVSNTKGDIEATLILWFIRLHARFYKGLEFAGHDELENEILSRLAVLLKEQSFEITLRKLILINIAAEYFAAERLKKQDSIDREHVIQSFYFFLRFNVRFLLVLLQTLQPELEEEGTGEDLPSGKEGSTAHRTPEKITVVARRVLPALRQYNTWLISRSLIIINTVGTDSTNLYIKQMWSVYADVVTKLVHFFPAQELPNLDYLLEEDETTVGFKPFRDSEIPSEIDLYTSGDGRLKPRSTDAGIQRNHPILEMKSRIRDIISGAVSLVKKENIPVVLDNNTFVFKFVEGGLQIASPTRLEGTSSFHASPTRAQNGLTHQKSFPHRSSSSLPAESVTASESLQSMDTNMHRMVDSLLEPPGGGSSTSDETSYGMHSLTATEVFAPVSSHNALQAPHLKTPKMLASLPGIWSSPFTPQPNELSPTSPNRLTTARQLSPFPLTNSQQQIAAAIALDEMHGRPVNASWARRYSRPSSNPMQPVNQILQESLAQQFMPMSMSSTGFSDTSSIYANTPFSGKPYKGGSPRSDLFGGNNDSTTTFAGASDFDRNTMLQSSIWNDSQPGWVGYIPTPPGGQGG